MSDLRDLSVDELFAENEALMVERQAAVAAIKDKQLAIKHELDRRAVLARFDALGPTEREILRAALNEQEA